MLKHEISEYACVNGLWVVNDEFGMILACNEYGMVC